MIKLFLNLFVLLSGTLNFLFSRKKWLLSLFNDGNKSVNLCSGLLTMSLKDLLLIPVSYRRVMGCSCSSMLLCSVDLGKLFEKLVSEVFQDHQTDIWVMSSEILVTHTRWLVVYRWSRKGLGR